MFYNALKRKGKGDDVMEEDVATVVAIHNNMNERSWWQVVAWENFCGHSDSKLLKFLGRPHDLSPLARIKSWLGSPLPFDRHDWTIQRTNGDQVRYVIDYYHDEEVQGDKTPALEDPSSIKSITVDARPAVDSLGATWNRIKHPIYSKLGWS